MTTKPKVFVVAGMPRTATTFLYHTLQKHPGLFVPFRKEVNYFTYNCEQGESWYTGLYAEMTPGQLGVDISPQCFFDDEAIARINAYDPEMKVILAIRNPVDWAVSFYNQANTYLMKPPTFREFLTRFKLDTDKEMWWDLSDGYQQAQIEKYRAAFGDRLLIYPYELTKKEPLRTMQTLERFVGVEPYFNESTFENVIINAGARTNVKWLTWLLSREWVINTLNALVPRKAILFFRNIFDRASARELPAEESAEDRENRAHAASVYANDMAFYRKLFADRTFQYGSGRPFGES